MPSYLGPLGGLVPVKAPSALGLETGRPVSFRTTIGGVRKAQVGPRAHRQWSVQLPPASRPDDLAAVAAFVAGEFGPGPFWWVDSWAQVTNVLPPLVASLERADANAIQGGPVALPDGGVAGRSWALVDPAGTSYLREQDGTWSPVPVLPGVPVTVSAWRTGAGAQVRVTARNIVGTNLATKAATAKGATWERVSVTLTPPADATHVVVSFTGGTRVARPTVTWTDGVMGYHTGQGAPQVIVTGQATDVGMAAKSRDGQFASSSFTITEVG